ncbi:MAG: hypothetical protein ASARMPREDX12_006692 [Alectoria sarmentosa]|nr:MAG: hypothetical protein ASARMPREDX12_006692 [Alectoria sarmentosa]
MNIDEPLVTGFVLPGRGRKRHRQGTESTIINRLPILKYLPRHFRSHFVAMCGEFIGTFLFLFFAFSGTQVANTQTRPQTSTTIAQASNPAQLLYISLCFGFSLAVNAWVFFRISGGLFNPAVTLGMCLVGALPYIRGVLLTVSQILGAISAAAVVSVLFPGPLDVRTALRIGTSITQGLFIEMFLTAQLVFTIFMLAAEKHKATFIAPVGIGLSLFIAELTGVFYTGGSVNPARSFGPEVVLHTFHHYHWIYWVGPILGSLLASGFYRFMKMLEYETANPGADFDEHEKEHFDPEIHGSRPPTIVNLQPSDQQNLEKHGETRTITGAEADHYDPDAMKASPGNHTAGKGRHRRMSALKGGRKDPGFSPAEASQKETEDLTDVYDAAPGAELGKASNRAHI